MYRAQDETDYPVENLNLADLAGVLWYLHNEVVVTCPRKFDISRIRRFRVTMQNTQALRDRIHSVFAPFMAFDSGRCTVPDADNVWQTDGFVVGCQIQRLEMGNYRSPVKTAKRCDRVEDDCYGPVWYSLPGRCPSQYYDGKTPQCTQNQPGGACANKNFTRADGGECTYFVEDAGEIELDQLTGIVGRYTDFCASGAREYVEGLDQGVSMTFWDNKTNEEACVNRMMAVQSAFHARYPNMPAHIDSPLCDA